MSEQNKSTGEMIQLIALVPWLKNKSNYDSLIDCISVYPNPNLLLEDLGVSTNWVRSCKESKIGGVTTELLVRLSLISIWSS
jgi:hypothetical protein